MATAKPSTSGALGSFSSSCELVIESWWHRCRFKASEIKTGPTMTSSPPHTHTHHQRLAGYPPFSDEITKYSLNDQILGAHYSFPEQYWKGVTKPARDMVKRLLTLDPERRITVTEALSHPWLQDKEVVGRAEKLMAAASPMPPPPVPTPVNVSLLQWTIEIMHTLKSTGGNATGLRRALL